ncbi:hypothetical protein [Pseudomonas schmalbachii]|uniref:Heme utilization protein n=1 Tax=Pseudomonas schmalbachii TaxID=2816993 RepID=A0ABS3TJC1_9PSED|nr:hypothetical protein [Pseudomonas schmalbachii]MBO3273759.1 hypothetical protein [Pseudomonas schmalbachii]
MKTKLLLTPLAFALASAIAVSGAYADSTSTTDSTQNLTGNAINSEDVSNTADAEGSSAEGNVGINSAAGAGNQQANSVALANDDEALIFGATANTTSNQTIDGNDPVNAVVGDNTATSGEVSGSGNVGVNVAAGYLNQQNNALSVANTTTSGTFDPEDPPQGGTASATSTSNQLLSAQVVNFESAIPDGEEPATFTPGQAAPEREESRNGNLVAVPQPELGSLASVNSATAGAVSSAGNAGVNVAAGIVNQQSNSLAIASNANATAAAGNGGGGGAP